MNNESLVQVDLKCSQVYLLSSILNYDFFKSNDELSFHQIMNSLLSDKNYKRCYIISLFSINVCAL